MVVIGTGLPRPKLVGISEKNSDDKSYVKTQRRRKEGRKEGRKEEKR